MITLVATTYNAEEYLIAWCESVKRQTVKPDEVIIVDGGSTDRTLDILRGYGFSVIYRPDLNIKHHKSPVAAGRNAAIKEAENGIICVTDAGCVLSEKWVEKITEPFKHPEFEVVGGAYKGMVTDRASERFSIYLSRNELPQTNYSSRSIAFRKSVWERVGGYPEVSLTAEDTLFNLAIKGIPSCFAQEAVVFWKCPTNIKDFARLQFRYAQGDGYSLIRRMSYAKITGKYILGIALCFLGLSLIAICGMVAIFWRKDVKLKLVSDLAKSIGYISGIARRIRNV